MATKYYWASLFSQAGANSFYTDNVIDEHPFRLVVDMNKMSKDAHRKKHFHKFQNEDHYQYSLKFGDMQTAVPAVATHSLCNWKEITEEEYRLFMALNKLVMGGNKYYTPELTEFCDGFEYETVWAEDENDWQKCTIGVEYSLSDFSSIYKHDANPTEFRVKCLDIEDVKSLGWNYLLDGMYVQFLGDIYDTATGRVLTWDSENNIVKLRLYGEDENLSNYLFNGTIKNKSELSRIMKMVGITK